MRSRRLPNINCPHCGCTAYVRSSEAITPLCRDLLYWCDNPDCGHRFVAQLAIVRSVSESLMPNPEIRLPVSAFIRTAPPPANDDMPAPANDDVAHPDVSRSV